MTDSKTSTDSTLRLALITQDFPPEIGGIQTYAHELADRIGSRVQQFEVVAPDKEDAQIGDAKRTYPVHRIKSSNNLLPFKALLELPNWIHRRNWDALFHAQWQTLPAALWARHNGWEGDIWVAAHARELLFNPYASIPVLGKAFIQYRRRLLQKADHFFPVSSFTAGLLTDLGVDPGHITVIHNGTSTDRFYPMDTQGFRDDLSLDGQRVLMTTSRLVSRKGIDTVIEAMPKLLQRHPDTRYIVLGDGPDKERLERRVEELQLGNHVMLMGRVPYEDLVRYYNICDVFVMPSRADGHDVEGFGLVFLEANACGKPVIGSRSGGIPDAIVDGTTGLLIPENDPEAIVEAVSRLFDDPEFMQRLGRQGLQRVRNQATWDHIADKMLHEMLNLRRAKTH